MSSCVPLGDWYLLLVKGEDNETRDLTTVSFLDHRRVSSPIQSVRNMLRRRGAHLHVNKASSNKLGQLISPLHTSGRFGGCVVCLHVRERVCGCARTRGVVLHQKKELPSSLSIFRF